MVKRKAAVLVVGGTLLVAVIGGIAWFLYWNSLPPQQFACWPPVTVDEDRSRTLVDEVSKPYSSTDPHSTISLTVDEVKTNKDGSGFLTYTLTNTADPNDPRIPRGKREIWQRWPMAGLQVPERVLPDLSSHRLHNCGGDWHILFSAGRDAYKHPSIRREDLSRHWLLPV